jgi:hypothetical protein
MLLHLYCWDLATKSDIVNKIDVESKSEINRNIKLMKYAL